MSDHILLQARVFARDGVPRPKGIKKNAILEWAKSQHFTIIDEIDHGRAVIPLIPLTEWELFVRRQKPTNGTSLEPENAALILHRLERIEEVVELILSHLTSPKES